MCSGSGVFWRLYGPDLWEFSKTCLRLRYGVVWQKKKGTKIIDMIRLDMPKVLFVSKVIEDPVIKTLMWAEGVSTGL